MVNPPKNVSDFFILITNDKLFYAENIRALLLREKVNVKHNFKFFSEEGFLIENKILRQITF